MDHDLRNRDDAINHLNVQSVDVSSGAEPTPILLDGVPQVAVVKLRQTFREYLTDSILPDGTPLSEAPTPQVNSSARQNGLELDPSPDSDDEQENDFDSLRGCNCDGTASRCSVADGVDCECVEAFGNFYSSASPGNDVTLNLDALPARLPLVECGSGCSCSSGCTNRTTQLGVRAPIVVRQSAAGLDAYLSPSAVAIPRGTFIALYAGEYLATSEARDRWSHHTEDNYTLSLRLSGQTIHIDPRYKGNVGRFLNHSCDPNCVILIVYWGASWPRAAIFTKRVVLPGEELSFDYGNASGHEADSGRPREAEVGDSHGRTKCLCGSSLCRGFMPFDETL